MKLKVYLAEGSLSIKINLVAPSNKSDEYDKIASMFKWEQSEQVVLSQGEFNEYVLDETSFAREARIMNQSYMPL